MVHLHSGGRDFCDQWLSSHPTIRTEPGCRGFTGPVPPPLWI